MFRLAGDNDRPNPTENVSCMVADWCVGEAESVTFNVIRFEPAVVGVPEITPVAGSIPIPAGKAVADQV